ncbi:MAG: hypothetical protein QM734_13560 [Cyclobacteriaceae bacterium]
MIATASASANISRIQLIDQIDKASNGMSLNGDHSFVRVNSAIGIIYNYVKYGNVYFNYAVSSRNPIQ